MYKLHWGSLIIGIVAAMLLMRFMGRKKVGQ